VVFECLRVQLEEVFIKYGRIRGLDIKLGKESGSSAFAFLEFDDARDAEDAQRARNGYEFGGSRMRVETAKGNFVSASSRGPPRRSGFRARVTGLPEAASWQDLKDHMREAGDVGYSNIERTSRGPVGECERVVCFCLSVSLP
jgi:arginine/serine-rich splicing factor 1/9